MERSIETSRVYLWARVVLLLPVFVVAVVMTLPGLVSRMIARLARWWRRVAGDIGSWWLDRLAWARAGGRGVFQERLVAQIEREWRAELRRFRRNADKRRRGLVSEQGNGGR